MSAHLVKFSNTHSYSLQ